MATRRSALARKPAAYTAEVVAQLQQLEDDLGGRQHLLGMLALAPMTPDLEYVVGMLGHPRHVAKSFAEICAMGNVLPGELLELIAQAALLRGRVRASHAIGTGIAGVVQDIMKKAAPYEGTCNSCLGTGAITPDPTPTTPNPTHQPCETCHGQGVLVYQAEFEKQKLAVELARLLPKGGGIQITNQNANVQVAGAAAGSRVAKFQELTDRILYGQLPPAVTSTEEEPPVDGEVADGL